MYTHMQCIGTSGPPCAELLICHLHVPNTRAGSSGTGVRNQRCCPSPDEERTAQAAAEGGNIRDDDGAGVRNVRFERRKLTGFENTHRPGRAAEGVHVGDNDAVGGVGGSLMQLVHGSTARKAQTHSPGRCRGHERR